MTQIYLYYYCICFSGQSAEDVANNFKKISKIAQSFGGICAGENNGKLGYNLTFIIAYIRVRLMSVKIEIHTSFLLILKSEKRNFIEEISLCSRHFFKIGQEK